MTCWPVTTTPRTMVGAAVTDTMPAGHLPMPCIRSTKPWAPKASQASPVRASTATSFASSVPAMTRVAQAWAGAAAGSA